MRTFPLVLILCCAPALTVAALKCVDWNINDGSTSSCNEYREVADPISPDTAALLEGLDRLADHQTLLACSLWAELKVPGLLLPYRTEKWAARAVECREALEGKVAQLIE